MGSPTTPDARPLASTVSVEAERLHVALTDGREVSVPLSWYPWLDNASADQQADFKIIEGGLGIWWEELDDGLSVPGLLGLPHM